MRRLAVVGLLVLASAAQADGGFWGKKPEPDERRARAQRDGDKYLLEARLMSRQGYKQEATDLARDAIALYEKALGYPGGNDADLHYRAYVAATYVDTRDGWLKLVDHADAFRAAKPLSPQLEGILDKTAMAFSKLGAEGGPKADGYFARAIEDYEKLRAMSDQADIENSYSLARVYSNEAEILMAAGRIEDAIELYKAAIEYAPAHEMTPLYKVGLAVAYDRDGQWQSAKRTMAETLDTTRNITGVLQQEGVFFVPNNDIHYYFALAAQVAGDNKTAIDRYQKFLNEVAIDRYKARAVEHLEELGVKVKGTRAARGVDEAD